MGERVHRWLAGGALTIALVGVIGWRAVSNMDSDRGGTVVAVRSQNLAELIPYASSPSDPARVVDIASASVALPRDPFDAVAPALVVPVARAQVVAKPAAAVTVSQWRVSATLLAGNHRAAVINDELVYVGDVVPGGGKLTSVERDHVVVTDQKGAAHMVVVKETQN
jgi:hypothetical protein